MAKKFWIVSVIACFVLLSFSVALLYGRFTSMGSVRLEKEGVTLGPLPMTSLQSVTIAPGMNFRIDTGSSVNTISEDYIAKLKKMGCDVDSSMVLTFANTAVGGHRIEVKRYRISLPVFAYTFESDSTGRRVRWQIDTLNRLNTVMNVDFVPVGHQNELPRFGMPFLKKFYVEYDHRLRSLRFHPTMPDNYEEVSGLAKEFSLFAEPRSFLSLTVDHKDYEFFLNTSMPRAGILFPASAARAIDNKKVYQDTIKSIYGDYPTVINYNAWVKWGDRVGNNVAYYCDYGVYPYALNPFNFLTQDALFDFENSKIYLHPYSTRQRRQRSNDIFALTTMPRH